MKKLLLILAIPLLMGISCTKVQNNNENEKIKQLEEKITKLEAEQQNIATTTIDENTTTTEEMVTITKNQDINNTDSSETKTISTPEKTSESTSEPTNKDLSTEYRSALLDYNNRRIQDLNEIKDIIDNDLIPMFNKRINTVNVSVSNFEDALNPSSPNYLKYSDLIYAATMQKISLESMVSFAEMHKKNFQAISKEVIEDAALKAFSEFKPIIQQEPSISYEEFKESFEYLNKLTNDVNSINSLITENLQKYASDMNRFHQEFINNAANTSTSELPSNIPTTSSEIQYQYNLPKINQTTCYINNYGTMTGIDCYDGIYNKTTCNAHYTGTSGIIECY